MPILDYKKHEDGDFDASFMARMEKKDRCTTVDVFSEPEPETEDHCVYLVDDGSGLQFRSAPCEPLNIPERVNSHRLALQSANHEIRRSWGGMKLKNWMMNNAN
ncbi:hypothetical protein [Vibrio sp. CUB2]|uniref:hypothetical protein n=1 Tax=Vibrio sp. CUB2 TaxID=2315233 RepID=UPI00076A2CF6|nr:hypothetical protein [Vibrio sp. CUB2]